MISNEDRINYYLNYNTKFKINNEKINIYGLGNVISFDNIDLKYIDKKITSLRSGIYKNYLNYLLTYFIYQILKEHVNY